MNKDVVANISYNTQTLTINGNTYSSVGSTDNGASNSTNIALGINKVGTGTSSESNLTKWYYFKIYDNDTLIRNYVPCYRKADSVVGMYDTVNNVFKISTGASQFGKD